MSSAPWFNEPSALYADPADNDSDGGHEHDDGKNFCENAKAGKEGHLNL